MSVYMVERSLAGIAMPDKLETRLGTLKFFGRCVIKPLSSSCRNGLSWQSGRSEMLLNWLKLK